jgi:hypothetical protein
MTDWLTWIWVPLVLAVAILAAMWQRGQIGWLLKRRRKRGRS